MMARSGRARGRTGGGRSGNTRSRQSYRTGSIEIFTRPHHNMVFRVLGWLVRLRAELFSVTVTVTVAAVLRTHIGPDQTAMVLGFTTVVVVAVPASRRYLSRRTWCVLDRHRVRACFVQTRTMTHDGKLPLLLWSRPSPIGERLRVWLPAGLSVKDLERVTAELAAACWARSTRITGTPHQAAFVLVDVVRHDPLSAAEIVPDDVEDLDDTTEIDPDGDDTVVPLPTREQFARRTTGTTPDAPRTTHGRAATGRTGTTGTSGKGAPRHPVHDEDADPSL